jgi:hypothetical protein
LIVDIVGHEESRWKAGSRSASFKGGE